MPIMAAPLESAWPVWPNVTERQMARHTPSQSRANKGLIRLLLSRVVGLPPLCGTADAIQRHWRHS
jgi:hypothetical protein